MLRYFAHGLIFSTINFLLLSLSSFILVGLIIFGFAIGLILGLILGLAVGFLILFLIESALNTFIMRWIWKTPVKTNWKSMLVHGSLLFITLVLVSIPSLIINLILPSIFTTIALLTIYCFIDGYIARAVASNWVVTTKVEQMRPGQDYPASQ